MTDDLVERVAKIIAKQLGDNFSDAFTSKQRWIAKRGMSGGRFREFNEPYQCDYLYAARSAITACQSEIREECAKVADQEADKCNECVAAGVGGPDGIASNMTRYRTACNIAQAIRSMKP